MKLQRTRAISKLQKYHSCHKNSRTFLHSFFSFLHTWPYNSCILIIQISRRVPYHTRIHSISSNELFETVGGGTCTRRDVHGVASWLFSQSNVNSTEDRNYRLAGPLQPRGNHRRLREPTCLVPLPLLTLLWPSVSAFRPAVKRIVQTCRVILSFKLSRDRYQFVS